MEHQGVAGVLADGVFTVEADLLGRQEVRVTLLKGLRHCSRDEVVEAWARMVEVAGWSPNAPKSEDIWGFWDRVEERVRGFVLKSIGESGARHFLVTGVGALEAFARVHQDWITLPSGKYGLMIRDPQGPAKTKTLEEFAELRRGRPHENHILVCPTHPIAASECGLFNRIPGAEDGAGVYVIGYGSRAKSALVNYTRCVNTAGKAKGFVHAVVSLDHATITNEDFDRFHALADPIERLQLFWAIADRQWGYATSPTLDISLVRLEEY